MQTSLFLKTSVNFYVFFPKYIKKSLHIKLNHINKWILYCKKKLKMIPIPSHGPQNQAIDSCPTRECHGSWLLNQSANLPKPTFIAHKILRK